MKVTELTTEKIGKQIYYFDETDSTNLRAKQHIGRQGADGAVFVAEEQNAGRGRLGRTWVSPKGTGLWFSILLTPDFKPETASMITLPAALAVADAIKICTGIPCAVKWPNDIVVHGKKVCGILTEMSTDGDSIQGLIIGIGINVNTDEFPEGIREMASSLKIEGGEQYDRGKILGMLLSCFEKYYKEFCQCGSLKKCLDSYNLLLINKGKKVKIIGNENSFEGEALGIDEYGHLLVKKEDGKIEEITSGEVSVRGLYGYV